jgi:hypothetical protein
VSSLAKDRDTQRVGISGVNSRCDSYLPGRKIVAGVQRDADRGLWEAGEHPVFHSVFLSCGLYWLDESEELF